MNEYTKYTTLYDFLADINWPTPTIKQQNYETVHCLLQTNIT